MKILTPASLYPLADVTGIELRVSNSASATSLWLAGSRPWSCALPLGLHLSAQLKALDSFVSRTEVFTSGLMLAMEGGDLRLLFLLDHNAETMELFVLDGSKLPLCKSVFDRSWSRVHTYRMIEPAVKAWYRADHAKVSGIGDWRPYPDARKRISLYLQLRDAGVPSQRMDAALLALEDGGDFETVVEVFVPPAVKPATGLDKPHAPKVLSAEDILRIRSGEGVRS